MLAKNIPLTIKLIQNKNMPLLLNRSESREWYMYLRDKKDSSYMR